MIAFFKLKETSVKTKITLKNTKENQFAIDNIQTPKLLLDSFWSNKHHCKFNSILASLKIKNLKIIMKLKNVLNVYSCYYTHIS